MSYRPKVWHLYVIAVVVAVVVGAVPLLAQNVPDGQPVVSQPANPSLDLVMLQRTGPGGDLEKAPQATALGSRGVRVSCVVPPETCYECLSLDSYNKNNTYDPNVPGSEIINVVQTTKVLTLGQPYLIRIEGTISYWAYDSYIAPDGTPEPRPMFYSQAVPTAEQGDVASDWEYQFAYPNLSHAPLFPAGPKHVVYGGISLNNGATFGDLVPLGGQLFSSTHSYSYLVEGRGLQAKFHVSDAGPHSDNYGVFKVCIYKLQPVTDCR